MRVRGSIFVRDSRLAIRPSTLLGTTLSVVEGSRFAIRLPIPGEHVVRQRDERVALAAGWERGEAALRAVRVFDRALVRQAGGAVLAEQREDVAPLIWRHCALLHDCANQTVGILAAALQQENDRQRDFTFAQVAADRLSERRLVGRVVEQIVHELKGDAEVEAVVPQSAFPARALTPPSMPPICAQPPKRNAVLRRMISKCSSSEMSTSPVLVS